jgi:hypothetical protein
MKSFFEAFEKRAGLFSVEHKLSPESLADLEKMLGKGMSHKLDPKAMEALKAMKNNPRAVLGGLFLAGAGAGVGSAVGKSIFGGNTNPPPMYPGRHR